MNKDGNDPAPKGFVSFFSLELSSSQYIRGKAGALRGYMGSHREDFKAAPASRSGGNCDGQDLHKGHA
jgi:hypothetical protein